MARDDNALTAQDVAGMLRVSRNTVYNLVKAGSLRSYSVGRKMRFTAADVDAYIASSRAGAAEPEGADAGEEPTALLRIAGSDLAADLVAHAAGTLGANVVRTYGTSYAALAALYAGEADAAVVHLFDRKTGQWNVPFVQRVVPGLPVAVIHLLRRRTGLLVRAGNPKGLRSWRDLLRDDVSIANRGRGAGERVLLDEQMVLLEAGARPAGYEREFATTQAAAAFVAQGLADAAVGSERVFHQVPGLGFLPLVVEELDLVLLKNARTAPFARQLLRAVAAPSFAADLAHDVGCDTARTGTLRYEV